MNITPSNKGFVKFQDFVHDDVSEKRRMRVSRERGRGSWHKKHNLIKITQFIRVGNKLNDILKALEREYWTVG